MATIAVTEANFAKTVEQGTVLLDFWAEWCGPCRAFAPVFAEAARRHPDVAFGTVNADDEAALAAAFDVRAIPTLMVLRDGILLAQIPGMMPAERLDELIEKVRALDMDEVRRRIAEAAPPTTAAAGAQR